MTIETREQTTDRWKSYFDGELKKIRELEAERVHKKVLLMAVLDAVSKPVYPRSGNRHRFIETIKIFGGWADGERVSLIHLARLLEIHPDPAFVDLRRYVRDHMAQWNSSADRIFSITSDPTIVDVRKSWPKGSEHQKPVGRIQLDSLTHASLFYQERNMLIHEYSEGGGGWDFFDEAVPYYQRTTVAGEFDTESERHLTEEQWLLVYPLPFLESLCSKIVGAVHEYLRENQLPALSHYAFGRYLPEELRE